MLVRLVRGLVVWLVRGCVGAWVRQGMGRLAEWSSLIPGAVRNSRYASLMVHPYEEETLLESCTKTKKFGFPSPNPHIRGASFPI